MAPFCAGSGVAMGTRGLQLAGDDCVLLWAQPLGLSSAGRAALAALAVFLLALLAQWLTSRNRCRLQEAKERAKLRRLYDPTALGDSAKVPSVNDTASTTSAASVPVVAPVLSLPPPPPPAKVSDWTHWGDSVLHGLRIFIAYLLMLAVMTYNAVLLASIVLGLTLGYLVFTPDTSKVPASADPCCS